MKLEITRVEFGNIRTDIAAGFVDYAKVAECRLVPEDE